MLEVWLTEPLCSGQRLLEEADGPRGRRGGQRGHQADARGPRQTGGGDIPARRQGQERLHQPRGVLWTEARRTL
ncbi:jg24954, partial [Pararge aegeria aegeria]